MCGRHTRSIVLTWVTCAGIDRRIACLSRHSRWTDTFYPLNCVDACPSISTWRWVASVQILLTEFTDVFRRARAPEAGDEILAGGVIKARIVSAFKYVGVTPLPRIARGTQAFVTIVPINARGATVTWIHLTVIDIFIAFFARVPLVTFTDGAVRRPLTHAMDTPIRVTRAQFLLAHLTCETIRANADETIPKVLARATILTWFPIALTQRVLAVLSRIAFGADATVVRSFIDACSTLETRVWGALIYSDVTRFTRKPGCALTHNLFVSFYALGVVFTWIIRTCQDL